MRKALWAAAAATAMISTVASAAVNFDSATGTGFAGKGDVQLALGMNNAALQLAVKNNNISFTYDSVETYDVVCTWDTLTGGPNSQTIYHDVTIPKHKSVNSSVSYDPRLKNQYTGFILQGFGTDLSTSGTVPATGDPCPGNNPGTVDSVTLTGSTGGLSVNGVPLPNTI